MKKLLKFLVHSLFAVLILGFNIYTTQYFAEIIMSTGSLLTVFLLLMVMVSINTVTIYSYLSYNNKAPKMRRK